MHNSGFLTMNLDDSSGQDKVNVLCWQILAIHASEARTHSFLVLQPDLRIRVRTLKEVKVACPPICSASLGASSSSRISPVVV